MEELKTKKASKTEIQIKIKSEEKGQVIIHCRCGDFVRLWQHHTFLIPHGYNTICKLVYSEGVSLFPTWTKGPIKFTLVFEGLPKGCKSFDFLEQIPQAGGFHYPNIKRNKSDIYNVTL